MNDWFQNAFFVCCCWVFFIVWWLKCQNVIFVQGQGYNTTWKAMKRQQRASDSNYWWNKWWHETLTLNNLWRKNVFYYLKFTMKLVESQSFQHTWCYVLETYFHPRYDALGVIYILCDLVHDLWHFAIG